MRYATSRQVWNALRHVYAMQCLWLMKGSLGRPWWECGATGRQDAGRPKGQYISLKALPRKVPPREDQAGRQNRETDPADQKAQVEALGASWVCTYCKPA